MDAHELDEMPDWTPLELDIRNAMRRAEFAPEPRDGHNVRDLISGTTPWPATRTVRADVIASLLLQPTEPFPSSPLRLQLNGFRITGTLDLGCGTVAPFLFTNCQFDEAPNLNDCVASFAGFTDCQLPSLNAARMNCRGPVWLYHSKVHGSINLEDADIGDLDAHDIDMQPISGEAALTLVGSRVEHDVNLNNAKSTGAIFLSKAIVGGSLSLDGANVKSNVALRAYLCQIRGGVQANSAHFEGAVDFELTKISGACLFNKSTFTHTGHVALDFDHAEVGSAFAIVDANIKGTLRMHHAILGCQLAMAGTQISQEHGRALHADHITVHGSLLMNGSMQITGSVELHGARIGCVLNFHGIQVTLPGPPRHAIEIDGAQIDGSLRADSMKLGGSLHMAGAEIRNQVILNDTNITSLLSSNAIAAAGCVVQGDVNASQGLVCTGGISFVSSQVRGSVTLQDARISSSKERSILLVNAEIGGSVVLDRSQFTGCADMVGVTVGQDLRAADASFAGSPGQVNSRGNSLDLRYGGRWRGSALRLDRARIAGNVDLRGANLDFNLGLAHAQIAGMVDLTEARMAGKGLSAVTAQHLTAGSLNLSVQQQTEGSISLRSARLGVVTDTIKSWPTIDHVDLEDLHYDRLLTEVPLNDRLQILEKATQPFSTQPYEEASRALYSAGNSEGARAVMYASVRRQHSSAAFLMKVWGVAQDVTVGYGYRPARGLAWIALLWLGGWLWFALGTGTCAAYPSAGLCPLSDPAQAWLPGVLALDLILPVVNLNQQSGWLLDGWSAAIAVALSLMGWLLLTTTVAAIARSVRRER